MSVKIVDNGLMSHLKKISKVADQEKEIKKTLEVIGVKGVNMLQNTIKAKGKTATGKTINSINHRVSKAQVLIGSDAGYAKYALETGRRPGKAPPVAALRRWAALKLGDPNASYAVAKSIAKKGTPAPRIFTEKQKTMDNIADKEQKILDKFFLT